MPSPGGFCNGGERDVEVFRTNIDEISPQLHRSLRTRVRTIVRVRVTFFVRIRVLLCTCALFASTSYRPCRAGLLCTANAIIRFCAGGERSGRKVHRLNYYYFETPSETLCNAIYANVSGRRRR
uniref:Uncharacterized protein n=1 Tax=Sipha flava TaxID=143950 RepID=A0A2S2R4H2_9HEMI